jgi:prepilin-type N-terminal cleavage/methylation domain-containing protein
VVRAEGGYTVMEMVIVMAILGVVMGGIVTLFSAGIRADADSTQRYQAQEAGRLALNQLRRDVHGSCSSSASGSYNTWQSSITLYTSNDSCAAGSHSITWCTSGSGSKYQLLRVANSATCTGTTKIADYLTTNLAFVYLPPNSHVTSLGTGAAGIATIDGSSTMPRLHVDLQINANPAKVRDAYRLVDDVVLSNGPRTCLTGVASC